MEAIDHAPPDDPTRSFRSYDEFDRAVRPGLLQVAVAITLDRESAADAVQDTLVEAYRRWDSVASLDRPELWARRVLVNRSIDWKRSQRRRSHALGLVRRDRQLTRQLGDTVAFWEAVRRLPRRQAVIVTLRTAGELSIDEIAVTLEIAPGTVKATLHTARAQLRRVLLVDNPEDPSDAVEE